MEALNVAPLPRASPFLKWVGGKRQLLPVLAMYAPTDFVRYWEPFVGGGALFFHLVSSGSLPLLGPSRRLSVSAGLNDANDRLMRTYAAVRDDVEGVIRLLRTYRYEKEAYYEARANPPMEKSPAHMAAWFIYLNKTCFNGLYRVNRKNEFNVPFGTYKNPTICDAPALRAASLALQGALTYNEDFEATCDRARTGDFVYLDPPYLPLSTTSNFASYTGEGFGMNDHVRLRDVALRLKKRGVKILLSNSSAPVVRALYADLYFQVNEVSARRSVNSKAEKRGSVTELLIS